MTGIHDFTKTRRKAGETMLRSKKKIRRKV
jgi:hypothetical protein